MLGAEFVLDGFYIRKHIKKIAHLEGGRTEGEREETEKRLREWVENENRKKLEE